MGARTHDRKAELIRAELGALGPRGITSRIPDHVRRRVVAYVRSERDSGQSWASLAERLGLSLTTLQRWSAGRRRDDQRRTLLPVTVTSVDPRSEGGEDKLVVITPGGVRVEGANLDQVVGLLRALG